MSPRTRTLSTVRPAKQRPLHSNSPFLTRNHARSNSTQQTSVVRMERRYRPADTPYLFSFLNRNARANSRTPDELFEWIIVEILTRSLRQALSSDSSRSFCSSDFGR